MTNLLKTTGAMFFALATSFSAVADQKPILDVIVPASNAGNTWKQGVMINEALKNLGFDSEMVHTSNCINNNDYISKASRPGIYFNTNSFHAANMSAGCEMKTNEETFLAPWFDRSQAFCVAKEDNFTSLEQYLEGRKRVTVGNTSSLPQGLYEDLSAQYGVEFVRVDYKGSSKTLKGLLADDVDMIYTGYSAREVNNPDINCFATTAGVANTETFASLFPNWGLAGITEFAVVLQVGLETDAEKNQARDAFLKAIATDSKLVEYYKSAHIITGDTLVSQGVGLEDWNTKVNILVGATK